MNCLLSRNSAYWVAEKEGKILGGCGIYPTKGLPENYAELVKFYLSSESRGKGIGKELMEMSFSSRNKIESLITMDFVPASLKNITEPTEGMPKQHEFLYFAM
jgi:GNAT superfamily N-acetyltransferase